jgi:hypothetical protein
MCWHDKSAWFADGFEKGIDHGAGSAGNPADPGEGRVDEYRQSFCYPEGPQLLLEAMSRCGPFGGVDGDLFSTNAGGSLSRWW